MAERARGKPWTSPAALVAAGAAVPFAFAPYGAWPLLPLLFALLFHAWHKIPAKAAAWRGFWFGLGMFGHGVWWIQVSIHQFGLPVHAFSVGMTVLFVAFMSLYPALVGGALGRLGLVSVPARILGLPALWVLGESLRGWAFSGFPWLLLGYSQIDGPLAGYAPVLGVLGVSLTVTVIASLLSVAITNRRARIGALVIGIGVVVAGAVLKNHAWTPTDGPPARVALVQGAVPQAVKWQSRYRDQTIELYAALSAPHWGTELILWPETALPAFPDEVEETLTRLSAEAVAHGSGLLVGMPRGDRQGGAYFNSVQLLDASRQAYDKHHLVPFGEYLPFDAWLRPLLDFLSIPMSDFSAGPARQPTLHSGRLRIGVSICYEDAYASEVRKPLPEANVLVNVSDDAWFGDSIAPHQHLEISRMRALETGRDLLRATNTGISAIIDARGRVLARSPQFEPYVLSGEFQPRRGATPYVQSGDWWVLALSAAMLLVAIWRRRPH